MINPGRALKVADIAVMRATVVFRKAVHSSNNWSMGAAMTAAEVGEAVGSVSLVMDGYYIGTGYPANMQANGSMKINYTAFGALVPIIADTSKQWEICVTLKPSAASASYSDFYIAQGYFSPSFDTEVRVLHSDNPVGLTGDATPFGNARVHVIGDSIFKNGFAPQGIRTGGFRTDLAKMNENQIPLHSLHIGLCRNVRLCCHRALNRASG